MADKKVNSEAQTVIEQPLIKVPSELLQRSLRITRKNFDRDFTALQQLKISSVSDIDQCIERVENLKRKFTESIADEQLAGKRLKSRVDHLAKLYSFETSDSPGFDEFASTRVHRFIADHMLRNGYHESAKMLSTSLPGLNELIDVELFESSRIIEESLNGKSCAQCLQWCQENRVALKKLKSPLEFMLRVQEFVELLKTQSKIDAIAYARRHFSSFSEAFMPQIQQAMALLAVYPKNNLGSYRHLLSDNRWALILRQFRADSYQLFSLPSQSLLSLSLQAGLSAFKTPSCYKESDKNPNCPTCSYPFNELAKRVPYANHSNSTIVCRISGKVIDEDNPPMVMPNGNVYSQQSLSGLANEKGFVIDPRTGTRFALTDCRKAFLA